MYTEFLRFELRYQLRQPLLWLIAIIFGLLAFGATSSDAITVGGSIGNVWRNAPTTIINLLGFFSLLGMFVIAIFIGGAMLRDRTSQDLLLNYPRPPRTFYRAIEQNDTVSSVWIARDGAAARPGKRPQQIAPAWRNRRGADDCGFMGG